jgi:hypothetical protein
LESQIQSENSARIDQKRDLSNLVNKLAAYHNIEFQDSNTDGDRLRTVLNDLSIRQETQPALARDLPSNRKRTAIPPLIVADLGSEGSSYWTTLPRDYHPTSLSDVLEED